MTRFKDLTGVVFERLTARDFSRIRGRIHWRCTCSCGKEVVAQASDLISGKTKSCGCRRRDETSSRFRTHGMSQSPEYYHYANMLARCTNPNNPDYEHYSRRGIKVCDEFHESFEAFYKEMGPKPEGKWSVGRIDNTRGYEIGNVRWETDGEQARNHSLQKNNTSGYAGIVIRTLPSGSVSVIAKFSDAEGNQKSKSFRVEEGNLKGAINLAISWRVGKLAELESKGIFYGDKHGKADITI